MIHSLQLYDYGMTTKISEIDAYYDDRGQIMSDTGLLATENSRTYTIVHAYLSSLRLITFTEFVDFAGSL